jgi:hypothetical protein
MKRLQLVGGFVLALLLAACSTAGAQLEMGLAYERANSHPRHGISLYGSYLSAPTDIPVNIGARFGAAYERERGHFQNVLAKTLEQAFRVGLTPLAGHAIGPARFYGGVGGGAELFYRKLVYDDVLPDIAYTERDQYDLGPFVEGIIGTRYRFHAFLIPFLEYHLLKTWHSEEVFSGTTTPVRGTSSSIRIGFTIQV